MKSFHYKNFFIAGLLTAILCMVGVFALVIPTFGQTSTDAFGISYVEDESQGNIALGNTDIRVTIVRIINVFLGLLGVVAVGLILYGGFVWMTAGGNDEKVGTARKILINAVIGLVIIMSAFAITSFVLNKLYDATNGDGTTTSQPCSDFVYAANHPGECGFGSKCKDLDYAKKHPTLCPNACKKYTKDFFASSITPVTKSTDMGNVVMRVIFNKPLHKDFTSTQEKINSIISKVTYDGVDVTKDMNVSIDFNASLDGKTKFYGVEVRSKDTWLRNGDYEIFVNQNIKSDDGTEVKEKTECGDFPLDATFTVTKYEVEDKTKPEVDIYMGGMKKDGSTYVAYGGEYYLIDIESTDNSGIGYIDVELKSGGVAHNEYDGPSVKRGSDAPKTNPYEYTHRIDIPDPGKVTKEYDLLIHVTDIDNNTYTETKKLVVKPGSCLDDTSDSEVCGGKDNCKNDTDCSKGYRCLDSEDQVCDDAKDCSCTAWPYINEVEFMNGAQGNWITIKGYHFGDDIGEVYFNYDRDKNGEYGDQSDGKKKASLAACVNDVWNDNWIVVEVPEEIKDQGEPNISVKTKNGFIDATNDKIVGPDLGTFVYNDITRPGLCGVIVSVQEYTMPNGEKLTFGQDTIIAPPSVPVVAKGKSFGAYAAGTSLLKFGKFSAAVSNDTWSDVSVDSAVPFIESGDVAAAIIAQNGEQSNSVPFTVSSQEDLFPPVITSIDPTDTTPESYVTIYGSHFGVEQGTVMIGGKASAPLPDYCGDTWSDTQIVVKVTPHILEGEAGIKVIRKDNGLESKGDWKLNIQKGDPKPSLCKLDPSVGHAPLKGDKTLTLRGENFSGSPTVFFWSQDADIGSEQGWLTHNDISLTENNTNIKSIIPVHDSQGYSMITGPIKIKSVAGDFSNSLKYSVKDCREPGAGEIKGYHCCIEGPEAGQWKDEKNACSGEKREAGYVWRFTTGKMPQQFYVEESCNYTEGFASPSPWEAWKDGKKTCINAAIQARFSLPIKQTSITTGDDGKINTNNIAIFTCGEDNQAACNPGNEVTSDFIVNVWGEDSMVFSLTKDHSGDDDATTTHLKPNTWYRIALKETIQSVIFEQEFGVQVEKNEDLLITRPCDTTGDEQNDEAYCFEFKTGSEQCALVGAGIVPPEYETKILGVVQDSRYAYIYDIYRIWDPILVSPLFYHVYGIADQECTSIDVDNKPWKWGPDKEKPATSQKYPSNFYENIRGVAKAWQHYPAGSDIYATLKQEGNTLTKIKDFISIMGQNSAGFVDVKKIEDIYQNNVTDETILYPVKITATVLLDDVVPTDTKGYEHSLVDGENWSEYRRMIFGRDIDDSEGYGVSLYIFEKTYDDKTKNIERVVEVSYPEPQVKKLSIPISPEAEDIKIDVTFTDESVVLTVDDGKTKKAVDDVSTTQEKKGSVIKYEEWFTGGSFKYIVGARDTEGVELLYGRIKDITFGTTHPGAVEDIEATSLLKINLGDPEVISKWPSCIEACINAEIGAQFNQIMDKSTFGEKGMGLYLCSKGEVCAEEDLIGKALEFKDNQQEDVIRVYSLENLEPATWYLVKITDEIKSVGKINEDKSIIQGNAVVPTEWKFRTKNSAEPCVIDNVDVVPDPFVTYYIGQKTQYNALPKGAPDQCSPYGQFLDPWDYGWTWDVEKDHVASVSSFPMTLATNSVCTLGCLPKGSNVGINDYPISFPVCGNGEIELGEDCDIAGKTPNDLEEIPGVSCTYSCLRPGNDDLVVLGDDKTVASGTCGDGIIQYQKGEECDFNDPDNLDYNTYCSNECLWIGSTSDETGDVNAPICGSGGTTPGEDCDITEDVFGCSDICLHTGTPLAQSWCDNNKNEDNAAYCNIATSVCGNGIVEHDEECEIGEDINGFNITADNCTNNCLLYNVCDIEEIKQCDSGDQGCNPDCTYHGSSVLYDVPSQCGDGQVGVGEYEMCETGIQAISDEYDGPVQIVIAEGDPDPAAADTIIDKYVTLIESGAKAYRDDTGTMQLTDSLIEGDGEYTLLCGNTEYIEPVDELYNDCPNNEENIYGVAYSSCCQKRPIRTSQYPEVNEGIKGIGQPVCRNTFIEVGFDDFEMDSTSFADGVSIVQGYGEAEYPGYSCEEGTNDVSAEMNLLLGLESSENSGFWQYMWDGIKSFFVKLFSIDVFAETNSNEPLQELNITWCSSTIVLNPKVVYEYDDEEKISNTTAQLYLTQALDKNAYVAVMLDGGVNGIHSVSGVGLKSPFDSERNDVWVFKTGSAICKINHIDVDPEQYLFNTPTDTHDFTAEAISNVGNQKIVRIKDVYDWHWSWHPEDNPLFLFSPTSTPAAQFVDKDDYADVTTVSSKGVEGHIDGVLQADIVADTDLEESQLGLTFTKVFGLTAYFCANPWPSTLTKVESVDDVSTDFYTFTDNKFHFDTRYCADDNNPLSLLDDLPLFDNIIPFEEVISGIPLADDTLRRYFLFSKDTDDVIGVQIFSNGTNDDGTRQTIQDWYVNKFSELGEMQPTSIDGYEALTNGTTYYINAYNLTNVTDADIYGKIFNNVYQFTINENAHQDTQRVFEEFMNNVRFNINMTDHQRCLAGDDSGLESVPMIRQKQEPISDIICATDFDCLNEKGGPLESTQGYCSNEKTKFFRDIVRLTDAAKIQRNIDSHFDLNVESDEFEGSMDTAFIPGYTNSRWAISWNRLGSAVGGLAIDPVNDWRGCDDHDPLTCWNAKDSTFMCPAEASVYEYKYNIDEESYTLFVKPEYILASDTIVDQFIDTIHVEFGRSCESSQITTINQSSCGDGFVNYATEQCDPPGKEKVVSGGPGCEPGYKTAVCTNECEWEVQNVCNSPLTPLSDTDSFLCGTNDKLDTGEFCDTVGGVCQYVVEQDGTALKPNVYILLDRSGSMKLPKNNMFQYTFGRWNEALSGLDLIVDDFYQFMNIGMSVWPDNTIDESGKFNCGDPHELKSLNSNLDKQIIKNVYNQDDVKPKNQAYTPTAKSIKYVYDEDVLSISDDLYDDKREKILILITDGKPSNQKECLIDQDVPSSGNIVDQSIVNLEVIKELTKLKEEKGVSTYVIGFEYDDEILDDFAQAGGTEQAYIASDAQQLSNVVISLLGCKEYAFNAVGSCSWDCTSYGGNCGDSYVQWKYEECDDGNKNNDDACKNNCTLNVAAGPVCGNSFTEDGEQCDDGNKESGDGCSATCTIESSDPICGDGINNQESEQCDLGSQNAVVCEPGYNETCTYCTAQCLIETKESQEMCGNGIIEEEYEVCDYELNDVGVQVKVFSTSTPSGIGEICSDKGSYSCVSECQAMVDGCVACATGDGWSIPKLGILNPMIGEKAYPFDEEYVNLLRQYDDKSLLWLGQRLVTDSGSDMISFGQYHLLHKNAEDGSGYVIDTTKGIETDPLCTDSYKLFFNKKLINDELVGNFSENELIEKGYGDLYDYPVNNEPNEVKNAVVMSPIVPPTQMRVVVRWEQSAGANINFVGGFYSDKTGNILYDSNDVCDTIDLVDLDGFGTKTKPFWQPNSFCNGNQVYGSWIHPLLKTGNIGIQSFTFDADYFIGSDVSGFYVKGLNGPINQFKSKNIWVDVYYTTLDMTALEFWFGDDNSTYSKYAVDKPYVSFHIGDAVISDYEFAPYWHVFNIQGGDAFSIHKIGDKENGFIKTTECQIKENMKNTTKCKI